MSFPRGDRRVQAALAGALLLPAAAAFPLLGVGLAGYGIYSSGNVVSTVFSNPNSTTGQKATAIALLGASIFAGGVAARNVRMGGFWRETPGAAALDQIHIRPQGQAQPTLRTVPRTANDIAVNPTAPVGNNGNAAIGGNVNQAAALMRYVSQLRSMRATDIRVNQHQVNLAGQRVGINRPDLQFTHGGRRWYIEWARPNRCAVSRTASGFRLMTRTAWPCSST